MKTNLQPKTGLNNFAAKLCTLQEILPPPQSVLPGSSNFSAALPIRTTREKASTSLVMDPLAGKMVT
jgi:hypothetical protein